MAEAARYEIGGYRPGALGEIVGLHARYYARHWSFGLPFETRAGMELAEYLSRQDGRRDLFLVACGEGGAVGFDQWSGDVEEQIFVRRRPVATDGS